MAKILVTGGKGFIGTDLVTELKKNKQDKIFVLNKEGNPKNVIKSDIRDKGLNLKPYDIIYHLAAISDPKECEKNPDFAWDVNVNGLKNIVEKMRSGQRLVFSSSALVYEQKRNKRLKETDVLFPNNFYSLTKIIGEELIKYYSSKNNFKYVILRFFNIYGKGQRRGFLIPDVIEKYKKNGPIEMLSPDSVIDMVYKEDAIKALVEAKKKEGIYNICTGKPVKIRDVYIKVKLTLKRKGKEKAVRGNKSYFVGDPKKFQNDFRTRTRNFESGIRDMLKK